MKSYQYSVQVEIPLNLTLEERELMYLDLRVLDKQPPSKRDIGYMLQYVYVQKKWFFYQTEKALLKKLFYKYETYPVRLSKNTLKNQRRRQHVVSSIQSLIYKRRQRRIQKK
uniref:Uncharacterized protein n=1 Tax=Tsukubamonas globosa TaxID=875863 RepID=W8VTH3_9EUKA|nr:hypothetical protein [Tsukubamonas globosa]BAO51988.1 hypothetical protein [Tsukubamonas globosa]